MDRNFAEDRHRIVLGISHRRPRTLTRIRVIFLVCSSSSSSQSHLKLVIEIRLGAHERKRIGLFEFTRGCRPFFEDFSLLFVLRKSRSNSWFPSSLTHHLQPLRLFWSFAFINHGSKMCDPLAVFLHRHERFVHAQLFWCFLPLPLLFQSLHWIDMATFNSFTWRVSFFEHFYDALSWFCSRSLKGIRRWPLWGEVTRWGSFFRVCHRFPLPRGRRQVIFLNSSNRWSGHDLRLLSHWIIRRSRVNIIIIIIILDVISFKGCCISLLSLVDITAMRISTQGWRICPVAWLPRRRGIHPLILFISIIDTLAACRQDFWVTGPPFTDFSFTKVCDHCGRPCTAFLCFLCHLPLSLLLPSILTFLLSS